MTWLRTTIAVPVASRPNKGASLFTTLKSQELCLDLNAGACDTWLVLAVTIMSLPGPLTPSLLPGKDLRLGPCSSIEASKVLLDIAQSSYVIRVSFGKECSHAREREREIFYRLVRSCQPLSSVTPAMASQFTGSDKGAAVA